MPHDLTDTTTLLPSTPVVVPSSAGGAASQPSSVSLSDPLDGPPLTGRERWEKVFENRRLNDDPDAQYFFEIDRESHFPLFDFHPSLSQDQDKARQRRKQVDDLAECLRQRLRQRSWGNTGFDLPAPYGFPPPAGTPEMFSTIFFNAADKVFKGDFTSVCTAFERFASGALRQVVKLPGGDREICAEPDSFYVLLFAEFALMCLNRPDPTEIPPEHIGMWKHLLPTLVKVQTIFFERFPEKNRGRWTIDNFGTPDGPPRATTKEGRAFKDVLDDIHAEYRAFTADPKQADRVALERKIFENLNDGGSFAA